MSKRRLSWYKPTYDQIQKEREEIKKSLKKIKESNKISENIYKDVDAKDKLESFKIGKYQIEQLWKYPTRKGVNNYLGTITIGGYLVDKFMIKAKNKEDLKKILKNRIKNL